MKALAIWLLALPLACTLIATGNGQRWRGGNPDIPSNRNGVADWEIDPQFEQDVFRFVRVKYESYARWDKWLVDFPDSDLNFSFRLQQLTAIKVNPDPIYLELTDERIFDYPFLYMIEPGHIYLSDPEAEALRNYCFSGGFLMVDDFWGEEEWFNFYRAIKQVFPDREPVELPLEHEIFHIVYDLPEKPQIPSIGHAQGGRGAGRTWERYDAQEVHYKGIYDDTGRLMVIICHNTDLGDGWEREGMDEWYFHEFSEKRAYPLGINIVTYAMTH